MLWGRRRPEGARPAPGPRLPRQHEAVADPRGPGRAGQGAQLGEHVPQCLDLPQESVRGRRVSAGRASLTSAAQVRLERDQAAKASFERLLDLGVPGRVACTDALGHLTQSVNVAGF